MSLARRCRHRPPLRHSPNKQSLVVAALIECRASEIDTVIEVTLDNSPCHPSDFR